MLQNCSCAKCGSKNVEISKSLPGKDEGFIGKGLRKLKDQFSQSGPLAGCYIVICKDCGHINVIQK